MKYVIKPIQYTFPQNWRLGSQMNVDYKKEREGKADGKIMEGDHF